MNFLFGLFVGLVFGFAAACAAFWTWGWLAMRFTLDQVHRDIRRQREKAAAAAAVKPQ